MNILFSDYGIERNGWCMQTAYAYSYNNNNIEYPRLVHKCHPDAPVFHLPMKKEDGKYICHNCKVPVPDPVIALIRLTFMTEPEHFGDEERDWVCYACRKGQGLEYA